VDRSRINSLNVFGSASAAAVHFHNKFDVLHTLISLIEKVPGANEASGHFFEVEYTTSVKGLPHSKQLAFNRDVINPQDGHILCDPDPATCGLNLRIQWASRIAKSTIDNPKEIVFAFIETALPRRMQRQPGWLKQSLAEKPKVGELQMDWLRSEDLKEEKNETAPIITIAFRAHCRCEKWRGVRLGVHRMNPEYLDAAHFNRYDALLRQEPDEQDGEDKDGIDCLVCMDLAQTAIPLKPSAVQYAPFDHESGSDRASVSRVGDVTPTIQNSTQMMWGLSVFIAAGSSSGSH
jgi:hypothetical protein